MIKSAQKASTIPEIEALRKQMKCSRGVINCKDLGAGSSVKNSTERKISDIARRGISRIKTCRLLKSITDFYAPKKIVELGTSLGIGTMYLSTHTNTEVHTFEGCKPLALQAIENFGKAGFENIKVHVGDITDTLPGLLSQEMEIDVAFIDANHRIQPLLHYARLIFPKMARRSIIIIDDIRWSMQMFAGWNDLLKDPMANLSLDLGNLGLLVLEKGYPKQHYFVSY